jgi:hypothetical protein
MVGVIVVRARGEHEIGAPLPNLADDLLPYLQVGHELPIVIVEHDVLDADPPARLLCLGAAAHRQLPTPLLLVTGIAVGDRHEADLVPECRPLRGAAARPDVTVVGVGAERDDAERLILGRGVQGGQHHNRAGRDEQGPAEHRHLHASRHDNEAACNSECGRGVGTAEA